MTARDIIAARPISEVWVAAGGDPPVRGRARAFYRQGDNPYAVSLNDAKVCWFDYRDGRGGGVLDLIQRIRGCDRVAALRWLAELNGITLDDRPLTDAERWEYARQRAEVSELAAWRGRLVDALKRERERWWGIYHGALRYTQMDEMTQHKKNRGSGKQAAFLAAYATTGNISRAAEIAEVSRKSHYRWLEDEGYVSAFDDAHEQACDSLEQEARRRAAEGVEEPVFYQGKECGTVRRYSDTLLIFLLKGAMPEKYKDRIEQHIKGKGILGGLSDEELERIARGGSSGASKAPAGGAD